MQLKEMMDEICSRWSLPKDYIEFLFNHENNLYVNVDDDDDERHGIFRMEFIIPGNIPRMSDGEALVAVVHFPDSPAQDAGGFLRICDDWRQQVRNTVVIR